MDRSLGTVTSLKALGYPGCACLRRCQCDELPCPLLTWLATELRTVCPDLKGSSRTGDILLVGELRKLLSNMFIPLTVVSSEALEPSILNQVTEFLVSELQAARIMKYKESHAEEKTAEEESVKEQRVEDHSCELDDFCQEYADDDVSVKRKAEMQAEWILLLRALDMDASCQMTDVLKEVDLRLARLPCGDMTNPLLKTSLSPEQWTRVHKINEVLSEDYKCRRQMIIKRFQVTLESFAWGENQKQRSEALASVPPLSSLAGSPRVSLALLIAAREDQSTNEPIKAGKSTPVYKTLMGSVPDRGGRPGEIEPPMPAWDDRRSKGHRSGRGGGHHQRRNFPDKKKKGKKE
ncbi:protein FAM98B [Notolabrus celidotus]|uniref:protein FAM98B n=1 Tax=Notolabrus celidotus TaxID=1203425 RepID=UPI00148FFBCF|nr:protein FAM98B [Notolabrus celidotus]